MGQGEREMVAAGLRQHVVERTGQVQEVLALVRVDGGIEPLRLGGGGPSGGRLPQPGQQQRADQPGGVVAEDAFGQPGEQDASVENPGERERALRRPEKIGGKAAGQHGSQLVHDRADDLDLARLRQAVVPTPETAEAAGVAHPSDETLAVLRVGQQQGDVGQGRVVPERQGQTRRAQHVLGARPPVRLIQAAEHPDYVVDDQLGIPIGGVEDVEGRRCLDLRGVEDHQPVSAALREPGQDVGDEVALGVEHRYSAPGLDVGEDQVDEERRLPGAGGADDVGVVAGVGNAECDPTCRSRVGVAERLGSEASRVIDRKDGDALGLRGVAAGASAVRHGRPPVAGRPCGPRR